MRLTELQPHWVGLMPEHAIGITFLCPHCRVIRVAVAFDTPIGAEKIEEVIGRSLTVMMQHMMEAGIKAWHREGETFETLTLTPSIDTSQHGHWHGFVTKGEVT